MPGGRLVDWARVAPGVSGGASGGWREAQPRVQPRIAATIRMRGVRMGVILSVELPGTKRLSGKEQGFRGWRNGAFFTCQFQAWSGMIPIASSSARNDDTPDPRTANMDGLPIATVQRYAGVLFFASCVDESRVIIGCWVVCGISGLTCCDLYWI